jgi:outer membrane protein assembly factor BamB
MPGPQATIESSPMVANGVVYVGENNGRVAAFDVTGTNFGATPILYVFGLTGRPRSRAGAKA